MPQYYCKRIWKMTSSCRTTWVRFSARLSPPTIVAYLIVSVVQRVSPVFFAVDDDVALPHPAPISAVSCHTLLSIFRCCKPKALSLHTLIHAPTTIPLFSFASLSRIPLMFFQLYIRFSGSANHFFFFQNAAN